MFLKSYVYTLIITMDIFQKSESKMKPKVVGGAFATSKQFPHAIFLEVTCQRSHWICGSSALNQEILITAAHCVYGCALARRDKIEAFGGNEDYGNNAVIVRKIENAITHEYYDEETIENDIAIVKAIAGFPLNSRIKRVIIPRRFPTNIKKGIVAGWGVTDEETLVTSSKLKFVAAIVRDKNICVRALGRMEKGTFCAGSTWGLDPHPSLGDSGSGLVVDSHTQIGLVSFRDAEVPALLVYTNLTYFYNWIRVNTKMIYCG